MIVPTMIDYNYLRRFAKRGHLSVAPLRSFFPNFLIAEYQRVNLERERATVAFRDASFSSKRQSAKSKCMSR